MRSYKYYCASKECTLSYAKCYCVALFLFACQISVAHAQQAGFELNLMPYSDTANALSGSMFTCGTHSQASAGDLAAYPGQQHPCTGAGDTTTPNTKFLTYDRNSGIDWESPEMVIVNIDGTERAFYHLIVGDLADGFIQETYVEMGFAFSHQSTAPAFFPDAPISNLMGSASAGDYGVTGSRPITNPTNGKDPLGAVSTSGNGTGNPNRVIMLQLNNDGEIFAEFRKDYLLNKPKFYQRVARFGDIDMEFEFDMQSLTYGDATQAGDVLRNSIEIFDESMAADTNFDVTTEAQNSRISGGMFSYADDNGGIGGSDGSYTYTDGGSFDQKGVDWEALFDAHDPTGNPWHYEENKPQ